MGDLFEKMPFLENGNICLKELTIDDLKQIKELLLSEEVYHYVPAFVPEKQCNGNVEYFINKKCKELFEKRIEIILGIYYKYNFCGLFEFYNYDKEKQKVSIGARLNPDFCNKGFSNEFLPLIADYLFNQTDVTSIYASNIIQNVASKKSLEKNGFCRVSESVSEDWGFGNNVLVDKWVLKKNK